MMGQLMNANDTTDMAWINGLDITEWIVGYRNNISETFGRNGEKLGNVRQKWPKIGL